MSLRPVKQIIQTKPTIEGAGVKLQRARERYFRATAEFHRNFLENGGEPRRDPAAATAEAETFAEYCRVLATFTELVNLGKRPSSYRSKVVVMSKSAD